MDSGRSISNVCHVNAAQPFSESVFRARICEENVNFLCRAENRADVFL